MTPLASLVTMKRVSGPEYTNRFNMFRSIQINCSPSPGYRSGQAMTAMEEVAKEVLPSGFGYAWMDMSYQEEKAAGGQAMVFGMSFLFVFLILAALYESWSLPFSVLLSVPVAVLGSNGGLLLRKFDNNVFAQIGLIMLIGLTAKNAILIVEFAILEHGKGKELVEAALEGARLRLRPILMTSFAFILGCVPLCAPKGAGALGRTVLGTAVIIGIREAFKSNYDLQLAVARVEQERALLGVSRSQYYPQVEYDASISGAQSQLVPNHTYYGYSFSTFWEIDLFGRLRKLNEAQRAVYFSSEEARRDVLLLVLSEVAQGYVQLRALDEQLAIAHRAVNRFQVTLELFQHKFAGGASSGLEVARAQAALSNVAAAIPDFERQIVAQENALALLLGRNPGPIARGAALVDQYDPPDVPAGLPATLLERRPDLREAEQNLISANAT